MRALRVQPLVGATGIDAAKTFYTGQGRPIQIVYKDGRVVKDLFA